MRLATIVEDGRPVAAAVRAGSVLSLAGAGPGLDAVRAIAAGGAERLGRVDAWVARQPARAWRPLADVELGPAVPDPGAIYAVGRNYLAPGEHAGPPDGVGLAGHGGLVRPLVYGKAPTSVAGHGATLAWDRSLTANVDAECELAVVVGEEAVAVAPGDALRHVFGYTIVDDVSSRDPWLDGDQWLLGKSMPGFCPVGPWVVTRDDLDPRDLRLGCTLNGTAIQEGRTAAMRHSIAAVIAYLSRHVILRPGDLVATGTPARLDGPLGPERHLEAGDVVTAWIEQIGELTTRIA